MLDRLRKEVLINLWVENLKIDENFFIKSRKRMGAEFFTIHDFAHYLRRRLRE